MFSFKKWWQNRMAKRMSRDNEDVFTEIDDFIWAHQTTVEQRAAGQEVYTLKVSGEPIVTVRFEYHGSRTAIFVQAVGSSQKERPISHLNEIMIAINSVLGVESTALNFVTLPMMVGPLVDVAIRQRQREPEKVALKA